MTEASGHIRITRAGADLGCLPLSLCEGTIGRLPDNWLVLPDASIARYQAELARDGDVILLTNLSRAAQVRLGRQLLLPHHPARLDDGALVAIGPYQLRYSARSLTRRERPFAALKPTAELLSNGKQQSDTVSAELPVLPAGASRYLYELPPIYHDASGFLGRYLKLFEAVWEPLEHRQDRIDMYFRPGTCPPELVSWLASWLGAADEAQVLSPTANNPQYAARQRQLTAEALDLYRWRGTHYALTRLIELSARQTPRIELDPVQPFMLIVAMPHPPANDAERVQIERLVSAALPAHVTHRFDGKGWTP